MNLDVKEFKETQVKIIQLEKDNQKLKSNCDQILRDNQQSLANLREKILNLEKSNLNLKAENQKMKAQCNQISQDKQQISAKFRENVTKMRELEELNFTLKSECDQYLEFSESAMEDQEILEKRLKEMVEEKNPEDCFSKKCENDKNDLNGRISEGKHLYIFLFSIRTQSFTSLMDYFPQAINGISSLSRWFNGTFHRRHW